MYWAETQEGFEAFYKCFMEIVKKEWYRRNPQAEIRREDRYLFSDRQFPNKSRNRKRTNKRAAGDASPTANPHATAESGSL